MNQTMEPRTITTRKGVTFTTTMTDAEALDALRGLTCEGAALSRSNFAKDLVYKADRLSEEQMKYVHKLVIEAEAPKEARPGVEGFDGRSLLALLNKASKHLKRPKIALRLTYGSLKLSRTQAHNKVGAGHIAVAFEQHGGRLFVGYVRKDGALELGYQFKYADQETRRMVLDAMAELADDPEGVVAARGKQSGSCCFCNLELTDQRSRDVGYGPVCARNYGLPWGGGA